MVPEPAANHTFESDYGPTNPQEVVDPELRPARAQKWMKSRTLRGTIDWRQGQDHSETETGEGGDARIGPT